MAKLENDPQHHEPFNVMVVAGLKQLPDRTIHWWQTTTPGIKALWHVFGKAPEIRHPHVTPMQLIHAAHKLTPTDDLPDKTLKGVERHTMLPRVFECPLHHLGRIEQADVKHGCQQ